MAPIKESTDETIIRPSVYNPDYLLHQSRWIRDDLDLQVARDGPDALHSNDILTLDEFLRRLSTSNLSLDDIRASRIHLAIDAIAGKATRWPMKLIDKAEALKGSWERIHGVAEMKELRAPLYESGGRLCGIARPEDVTNEKLLVKWLKAPGLKVSPQAARRRGDLGFKPGEWVLAVLVLYGLLTDRAPAGGSAPSSPSKPASSRAPSRIEASHSTPTAPTPSS